MEKEKEKIFKQLYLRSFAPFCIYASRFIDDGAVCEDLVSDVFVTIWNKADIEMLQSQTIMAFIKTAVKNKCLNYINHEEYFNSYKTSMIATEPDYATAPDQVYDLKQLYELLEKRLEMLPEEYKNAFIKSFYEGKSQSEIAEELNISVKSVSRYKKRILDLLRKDIKEYLTLLFIW